MVKKALSVLATCLAISLILTGCMIETPPITTTPPEEEPSTTEPAPPATVQDESEESQPEKQQSVDEEVTSPEGGVIQEEEATPPSEPETPLTIQESTIQLPEVVKEVTESTELIYRDYTWVYGGKEWTWELEIPQSLYDYYKGTPRPPTDNYSIYVTHPWDDIFIGDLVSGIEEVAQEEGYSEFEKVEFTNTFVQSLPYTADSVTTSYDEYPRYPLETLVNNGGDCEDTAILLASLLDEMGYGVILLYFPGEHTAVGILGGEEIYGYYWEYDGDKYYYIETTNTGWGVGQCPEEYQGAYAYYHVLTPTPILVHTWSATGKGSIVELEVIVQNLGSAIADDVYIFAGFDAGEDMFWNIQESELFDVGVNQQVIVKLYLQIPFGEYTRLGIQIVDDGYAMDESYSDWFNT